MGFPSKSSLSAMKSRVEASLVAVTRGQIGYGSGVILQVTGILTPLGY
jgi:hypothetical protein